MLAVQSGWLEDLGQLRTIAQDYQDRVLEGYRFELKDSTHLLNLPKGTLITLTHVLAKFEVKSRS